MGIDVIQWRASIGKFNKFRLKGRCSRVSLKLRFLNTFLQVLTFCQRLLFLMADIVLLFVVSLILLTFTGNHVRFASRSLTMYFVENLWWLILIVLLSGDVHENPGPNSLKILHWNVNSITTDNF